MCYVSERFFLKKKLMMTIDEKLIDEKLQYDINRETEKITALLLRNIDKN